MDTEKGTFKCFDGSKSIKLAFFNDGFPDCPDGSDEPGTSSGPESQAFYCLNGSTYIPRWEVGDGNCDCCDCSDEFHNKRAKIVNTCNVINEKKDMIINKMLNNIKNGKEELKKFEEKSKKLLSTNDKELEIEVTRLKEGIAGKPLFVKVNENQLQLGDKFNEYFEVKEAILFDKKYPLPYTIDPEQNKTFYELDYNKKWNFKYCNGKNEIINETIRDECVKNLISNATLIKNKLKKIKDARKFTHNKIPLAFISLLGNKFENGIYTLDFLSKVTQGSYKIGSFTKFVNNTLQFENGDYCDIVKKNRKASIKLMCWDKNILMNFNEPNICEYESIFATPAVCTNESITEIKNYSLKELKKLQKQLLSN